MGVIFFLCVVAGFCAYLLKTDNDGVSKTREEIIPPPVNETEPSSDVVSTPPRATQTIPSSDVVSTPPRATQTKPSSDVVPFPKATAKSPPDNVSKSQIAKEFVREMRGGFSSSTNEAKEQSRKISPPPTKSQKPQRKVSPPPANEAKQTRLKFPSSKTSTKKSRGKDSSPKTSGKKSRRKVAASTATERFVTVMFPRCSKEYHYLVGKITDLKVGDIVLAPIHKKLSREEIMLAEELGKEIKTTTCLPAVVKYVGEPNETSEHARSPIIEKINGTRSFNFQPNKKFVSVIFKKGSRKRYDYFVGDNQDLRVDDFVVVPVHENNPKKFDLKIVKIKHVSARGEISTCARSTVIGKIDKHKW